MPWKKLRKIPKNNGVISHRKCPEIRKGARQKWFKFRALWFWRHVHHCIWREQKHVWPAWREIEAAAATTILDHDIVKSSWKYRLLRCCVTRDVTQSNGHQEGSFIFLFSVSCFDEEVIFFIYFLFLQENKKRERADSEPPCPLSATYLASLRYLSQTFLCWKRETIWSTMSVAQLDLQD